MFTLIKFQGLSSIWNSNANFLFFYLSIFLCDLVQTMCEFHPGIEQAQNVIHGIYYDVKSEKEAWRENDHDLIYYAWERVI